MADYLALLSVPHTRVDWPVAGCGLLAPIFDADGTISAHLRVSYRIALVKIRRTPQRGFSPAAAEPGVEEEVVELSHASVLRRV
jgi:hypothetical protein